MNTLHANWTNGRLFLWAESSVEYESLLRTLQLHKGNSSSARTKSPDTNSSEITIEADHSTEVNSNSNKIESDPDEVDDNHNILQMNSEEEIDSAADIRKANVKSTRQEHPFILSYEDLSIWLHNMGIDSELLGKAPEYIILKFPAHRGVPEPSPHTARLSGIDESAADAATMSAFSVIALSIRPEFVLRVLTLLDTTTQATRVAYSSSLRYWIIIARFISELIASQRFVPVLTHSQSGHVSAGWRLWLHNDTESERLSILIRAMPPSARCIVDEYSHHPWLILRSFLNSVCDSVVRNELISNDMITTLTRWDMAQDSHVGWLNGLLGTNRDIKATANKTRELINGAREWLDRLAVGGKQQDMRLLLQLTEPALSSDTDSLVKPDKNITWLLTFNLQSTSDPNYVIDAARIWTLASDVHAIDGRRVEHPQDILLSELSRAAKVFTELEPSLDEAAPSHLRLTTQQAYTFLREVKPLLDESGIAVEVPTWWDTPESRLAARLYIESEEPDLFGDTTSNISDGTGGYDSYGTSVSTGGESALGLDALVGYSWRIALGDQTLTTEEFEQLTKLNTPLVKLRGRWVEVHPDDIRKVTEFMNRSTSGQITVREALRLAYGSTKAQTGLPILGMDASGWVGQLFGSGVDNNNDIPARMPTLPQPEKLIGVLRPYQLKGLSWLAFLDRIGLGSCLADDMGLGKTVQLIALLLWEREQASRPEMIGPTLLVVPMSVVGNWVREIRRFAPSLKVLVHHGANRLSGSTLQDAAAQHDVVITTFALGFRDHEELEKIYWWRIGLDEAQNIKNPTAKQTIAIKSFKALRKVTLTGTPVENRLSELWSIMDFCNTGFLGPTSEFRRVYALPIERFRDRAKAAQLRGMIQPFILRRLKSDPNVIADLPDKLEYKVYCNLSAEQANLYEQIVNQMLENVDAAQGIQRKGLVLASLTKLKQICNHPMNYLKDDEEVNLNNVSSKNSSLTSTGTKNVKNRKRGKAMSGRSGKSARLVEMLEEVLAEGDSALIFTQYRQMGHLLVNIIRQDLDVEPLYLHGGSPAKSRQQMIDKFQCRDGTAPIFILSLKAGGFGLNLTAANHVFHYDRWWNPAVENQATDRAFRIGQTRTVQVHKFVCSGTLEERIDQMIEQKVELADNVVGSGEQWLTELTSEQLHKIVALRHDDIADEPELDIDIDNDNDI